MLAALAFLNANKNIAGVAALVFLGAVIVIGSYSVGRIDKGNEVAAGISKVNVPLAKLAGKDEAEVTAEAEASKKTDAVIAGAVKQSLILNEETARLVNGVH